MGCVSGKPDINDIHPNIFEVTNVDERGHPISPGQLELTEAELILHQRRKAATRWPLKCVRKYGFDSDIFSFECGRRCHTGAGIYAFKCTKAEQLFNLLQQNIQLRNISDETGIGGGGGGVGGIGVAQTYVNQSVNPADLSGPTLQRRLTPQTPEGYLKPISNSIVKPHPNLSRPGSLTSSDPASPLTPVHSPPPDLLEHNNNKGCTDNAYTNASVIYEAAYSNFPSLLPVGGAHDGSAHLYMNVETGGDTPNAKDTSSVPHTPIEPLLDEVEGRVDAEPQQHCYANIGGNKWHSMLLSLNQSTETGSPSPPPPDTPTYVTVRKVNYAELDLVPSRSEAAPAPPTPDTPNKTKSYVTIDFKKTNALSQSVNPNATVEEGSRKTRHNSTISDVARHSNSLSD